MTATLERTETPPTEDNAPYGPQGTQVDVIRCRDLVVVLEGPADTGKTRTVLEKIHACMEKYPGARAVLARQTRRALTDTVLATFENKVLPKGHYLKQGAKRDQRHSYSYRNGSEIICVGLDEPEKLFSLEADMIFVGEVSQCSEGTVDSLKRALRNGKMPYQQMLLDLNPTQAMFWLYEWEKDGRCTLFYIGHRDNPSITEDRLNNLRSMTGVRYKRLYLGERVAEVEGTFYGQSMYDAREQGRIKPSLPVVPGVKVWTCWDLGVAGGTGKNSGYMAIWCFQVIGTEWRWLKYFENFSKGLSFYSSELEAWGRANNATFARCIWPHDGRNFEMGAEKTRAQVMEGLGWEVRVLDVSRHEDRVEAANKIIALSVFDEASCHTGIQRLIAFKRPLDEKTGLYLPGYVHDEASHGATAFELAALGYVPDRPHQPAPPRQLPRS